MNEINHMHFLRVWATQNQHAHEPIAVSSETTALIAEGILTLLGIADATWELAAGRQLTDEEKQGTRNFDRCPECGQAVPNYWDHLGLECHP